MSANPIAPNRSTSLTRIAPMFGASAPNPGPLMAVRVGFPSIKAK